MQADRLNSMKEVAEYLNVSTKTIQRMVKSRKIPYALIGQYPKFDKEKIDKWIEKRTIIKN